ncbi:MAG TPA: PKD domain-containing protein [Flavobacteriales bacterium]|nr:PKD domain-containing protein [Flavobacteriales bacterium]
MDSYTGGFNITVPCAGSVITSTITYEANAIQPASNILNVTLNCGAQAYDCDGLLGGNALPGTACDDGNALTFYDTWSPGCQCLGGADPDNFITVSGTVTGCSGAGVPVGIYAYSTPMVVTTVLTDANCNYSYTFYAQNETGAIEVYVPCTQTVETGYWTSNPHSVDIDLACGAPDCLGVPGGPAVVGTPCDDGDPLTFSDMYFPNCTCTGVTTGECYTWSTFGPVEVDGAIVPFEVQYSVTTAGAMPITYSWYFGDVSIGLPFVLEGTSTVPSWSRTFSPGESLAYEVVAVDANGCESVYTNVEAIMPCDGILGSLNIPNFPCTNPAGATGTWNSDCECIVDAPTCQACFTFTSPEPFVVDFSNCSVPPSGENDAQWELPDGSIYTPPQPWMFNSPSYTFDSPGVYPVCFTILDFGLLEGCTFCKTLYVDELGTVSDTPQGDLDCLGVPGGPAVVGTPCDDGDPLTFGDMYYTNCNCIGVTNGECYTWSTFGPVEVDGAIVPFEVQYSVTTAGALPITYSWYFGDVTIGLPFVLEGTSTVPSWSRTFGAWESLAYRVVAVDANGCESEFTNVEAAMPCDGILGSFNIPNMPCSDPVTGETGTWNSDCECIPEPSCLACYNTTQSTNGGALVPFTADLSNCTTGGTAPYAYNWTLNNATFSTMGSPEITFPATGIYIPCLNVTDANGNTCTDCDTLFVDVQGIITPYVSGCQACLEVVPATNGPSGPAIPWTVDLINCSTGSGPFVYNVIWGDGMDGQPGTHVYSSPGVYTVCLSMSASACDNTACTTVVVGEDGTINPTVPCEAGFFVMQAYEWVEEPGNPNGGGGEPIPNELWVWNLSSGGTGLFQFTWSFGDGTSSTDAYPTHTYASGEYELCLTVTDNAGCTDQFCQMVSVDADGILNGLTGGSGNRNTFTIRVMDPLSTGLGERSWSSVLNIWPNPVTDVLYIELGGSNVPMVRVNIVDLGGRVILDATGSTTVTDGRMSVPVGSLSDGLYIVRVSDEGRTLSGRFAKGH